MAKKPKDQWHNFDYDQEKRLGTTHAVVNLTPDVFKKLMDHTNDRVNRKTGLRFKFIVSVKVFDDCLLLEAMNPYIFPNKSSHTDVYNSDYNRLEVYIPQSKFCDTKYIDEAEIAISFNKLTLEILAKNFVSFITTGLKMHVCGNGAFEIIDKKQQEPFASFQIFGRDNIFSIDGKCEMNITTIRINVATCVSTHSKLDHNNQQQPQGAIVI